MAAYDVDGLDRAGQLGARGVDGEVGGWRSGHQIDVAHGPSVHGVVFSRTVTRHRYPDHRTRHGGEGPWPALFALCLGFFMILVDSTIVSVATPAIIADLDADVNSVVWVTSAYLLAYAVPDADHRAARRPVRAEAGSTSPG